MHSYPRQIDMMIEKLIYDLSHKKLKEISITKDKEKQILHVLFDVEGVASDVVGLHVEVKAIRESINGKIIYEE